MTHIGHNGGPAFPYNFPPDNPFGGEGMSLRDWFAGQALVWVASMPAAALNEAAKEQGMTEAEVMALAAYDVADAMLAAREGKA